MKRTEVHVWRVLLKRAPPVIQNLQKILSEDELVRADRFHFSRDKEHFIVARGFLRTLLARYLNLTPSNLTFFYNAYGKPALDESHHHSRLCFNVSHSHGIALYAVTLDRKVGVDIEYVRADFSTNEIADRFFSANERTKFAKLPLHLQTEAFFNCWTRKEAYIKAKGKGLSMPLDKFDVSLAPDEPAALLRVEDAPEEASRWCLQELTPGPGYKGALAVEGHGWEPRNWEGSMLLQQ